MNLNYGDTQLIIAECRKRGLLRNQAAYVLATVKHETAGTMKPVREYGTEAYLKAKKYYPYVGMGYVQLTWKENYADWSKRLGVDFVKNPKLLLDPDYAKTILVEGMRLGTFTTHKLSDYITLTKSDFRNARKIVNGMDKADLIAGYAKKYDAALKAAGYGVETPPTSDISKTETVEPTKEEVKQAAKAPLITILIGVVAAGLVTLWDAIISLPCDLFGWFFCQ